MATVLNGTVVSTKGMKTAVVQVDRRVSHPIYRKQYTISEKFHIHDENNEAKEGDVVEFISVAPISKLKRWKLQRVVSSEEQ